MIISAGEVCSVLTAAGGLSRLFPGETMVADPEEDEIRWCRAAVRLAPAIRQDRIHTIQKALIVAGYCRSAEEVAAKMIERSLVDAAFSAGPYGNPWPSGR